MGEGAGPALRRVQDKALNLIWFRVGVNKSYYGHSIMKTGFIYTDAYFDYDYGPAHPLKIVRLKLTLKLWVRLAILRFKKLPSATTSLHRLT